MSDVDKGEIPPVDKTEEEISEGTRAEFEGLNVPKQATAQGRMACGMAAGAD